MREKYGRYPLRWTGEKAKYQFPHLHPALKPARMGESPELESARNWNRPGTGIGPQKETTRTVHYFRSGRLTMSPIRGKL